MIVSHHGQTRIWQPQASGNTRGCRRCTILITSTPSWRPTRNVIETDVAADGNWTNYTPSIGRKLWKKSATECMATSQRRIPLSFLLSGGLDSATCLAIAKRDQGFADAHDQLSVRATSPLRARQRARADRRRILEAASHRVDRHRSGAVWRVRVDRQRRMRSAEKRIRVDSTSATRYL